MKRIFAGNLLLGEITQSTVYWVKKGISYCIDMATENGTEEQQRIASIMKETILRNGPMAKITKLCNQILEQVEELNVNLEDINNNISSLIKELSKMVSENAYYEQLSKVNVYAMNYNSLKDTGGLMDQVYQLVEVEKDYIASLEAGNPVKNEHEQNYAHIFGAKLTNLRWVKNVTYNEKVRSDGEICYEVLFDIIDPHIIMGSVKNGLYGEARMLYTYMTPYEINTSQTPEFIVSNTKSLFSYAYDYCKNYFVTEAQYTDFYDYQLSYVVATATNMLLYLRFYFEFWNASGLYEEAYDLYEVYQASYNVLVNAIKGACLYVDELVGKMMRSYDVKQNISMKYVEKQTFSYDNALKKAPNLFPQFSRRTIGIESVAKKTKPTMLFYKMNIVGGQSYLVLDKSYNVTKADMSTHYKNDIKNWSDEHYYIQSADYMNLLDTSDKKYTLGKWQKGSTSSDISRYFSGKSPCIGDLASWLANDCGLGAGVPNAGYMILPYYKQDRPDSNTPAPMTTAYFSDKFYWQNVTNLSQGTSFDKREEISSRSISKNGEPILVVLYQKEHTSSYSLTGGNHYGECVGGRMILSRDETFTSRVSIDISSGGGFYYVDSGSLMYLKISSQLMKESAEVILISKSDRKELAVIATNEDFKADNSREKIFAFRMPYQDAEILWRKK